MAQYDLVSNDGTPFSTEAEIEQANEASGRNDNVVTRSLRGGVYGAGSQLTSLADASAEAAGFDGVSKSLRGVSGGLREQAALPQNSPKVGSFRQLREDPSLDNAGEYLGGLVGGSLPAMGAGIAGGLVGGIPGAALALTPFESGDVVQRQQADPTIMARPAGERLRDALVTGGGSAALQGVVPGMIAGRTLTKVAGAGARETVGGTVKRNAGETALESAGEASGEVVKQLGTDINAPLDREAVLEAAIGGAAAGSVMSGAGSAVGAAIDVGRSPGVSLDGVGQKFTSIRERVAAAAGAAKASGDAVAAEAPKRMSSLGEDLGSFFTKARESGGDAVQRVKAGAPLGDLKEWAGAQGTRLKEMTDLSDNATAQKVKEWGEQMVGDVGLTPERRQQVTDAMANAGDRASQVTMAGLKEGWDKGRALMGKAQALRDSFGTAANDTGVKKSEDYSGTNKAIADKLGPLLTISQPDLAGNAEAMSIVADSVRQAVERMPRGALTVDTMFRLVDTLGADTASVLDAAFREIGDMEQRENFYVQLNELADLQKRTRKLEDLVAGALTEESQGMIRSDQMGEFTRLLVSHARGERADPNAGPAQRAAAERHFREQLALHFGPKATAISLAIEKEAGLSKDATEGDVTDEEGSDGGFDEDGKRTNAEQTDVVRKGRGAKDEPVMDPALFKSSGAAGQNYGAQLLLDMQAKYPGHDVRFEKAEGSATHGYVVAEKAQDKDALNDVDIAGMKLDTKRYANSKDRIEVGGNILDTRRITKVMDKRMPYSAEGQTRAARLAEMFSAGVARLMERYGTFEVADSVVIGTVADRPMTYGAAKKMDKRTKADLAADARTSEMNDLRAAYKMAKADGASAADLANLRVKYMGLVKEQAAELDAELGASNDGNGVSQDPDETQDADKAGNIHVAAKRIKEEDLVNRSNMDGSANSAAGKDRKGATDLSGPVMAAAALKRAEAPIARKIGDRLAAVLKVSSAMSAKDARLLATISAEMAPAKVAEILNPLARTYAGAVSESLKATTPKAAEPARAADPITADEQLALHMEYLNNPPADYTTEKAREILAWAKSKPKVDGVSALVKKAESVLEGDESLADFEGGTPNPKARAAQVAASTGDADAAYALTKRSAQTVNPGYTQTSNLRQDVADHVLKVLGPKVRLEWKNLTHAGEFERMRLRDVIRISVHALDPMSVAHHESLHAFFAQLRDVGAVDVMGVLDKAASSSFVLDQLKSRFAGQPAVLAQLKDPEERVAYMYQMWATDPSFRVAPSTKGTLGKVAAFIRKVLGIWSNDERALHIMGYFHSGEYAKTSPSVAAAAMAAAGRNPALDNARKMAEPVTRFADAVVATGSGRMRDTEIPALVKLADIIKREHTDDAGGDRGFVPAARVERTKRLNELGATLMGYEKATLDEARDALQNNTRAPSPEARLAVRAIKGVLAQTRDYMVKAGVEVGDLGVDYFPRVWDFHFISKNQQAFRDMLAPHVASGAFKGNVDDFVKQMAVRDGVEDNTVSTQPGMQFKKERLLAFVTPAEAAPFVKKDLLGTLSSYVTQATRKAEWHRRLGDGKLERILSDAKSEGATKADLDLALNYLRGIDGTLGDDINPHLRRLMGNMIVYQNIRLLPLAVFSSVVDPVGIMVRGGTVRDAWTTFKRGMSEIPQSYGKAGTTDRSSEAAELIGVIDSALLTSVMGDIYTQGMVGGTAQRINTAFFKYNMMEGLNRSFRVGATEAAMKFIVRHHAGGAPHSARWMAELGLRAGDVKVMPDGRPALTVAEGLSAAQEARVHAALNQWVDGAVLRPDAADKPLWMNDPRWALVSHLKQFVYSFQKVILARVTHELKMGNYTPMMALAAYVPVMIAADFAKGTLQGGGDQPEWKQGWDMSDYLAHGVQRAGLLGVGQFGVDINEDMSRGGSGLGALVGPTIEQFGDVVQVLGGQREFGSVALKAMPANALYAEYARNGAVDDGGAAALE